ncbi:MAG: PhnD/SsuA/transferrin family substrate-binding protein, partial [Chloroflexota bacterium]
MTGRRLNLVTYLGAVTTPIAAELADAVSAAGGLDMRFDAAAPRRDRLALIDAGEAHVLWACGLLTVERLAAGSLDAEIVAAPVFPGERSPVYRSMIVARRSLGATSLDDLAGARLAINEPSSWSGHHALRAHLAALGRTGPFFGAVRVTGGHDASVDALLEGTADAAAIDHTIWDDRRARDRRADDELVVVDRTRDWPAPPFSVSRALAPEVRDAVSAALVAARPRGLEAIVARNRAAGRLQFT